MANRLLAWLLAGCLFGCGNDDKKPIEHDAGSDAGIDAGGGGGLQTLDRSAFADVGVSAALDYATPEYWLCRPDITPNECARNLDATEIKPDGTYEVVKHVPAVDPGFDCFYVYPTVWLNKTDQMTDFSQTGVEIALDALLNQAARFTSICRVFVPLYRQNGLAGVNLQPGANTDLALQDVRDAFAYYLEHDNGGRKFVLLSHSQGTYLTTALIRRDIDENAELRARLISALLIGGQPYTAPGMLTGGSFKNIPSCSMPGETGCVIAYNSYAKEAPATATSTFGHVAINIFTGDPVDANGQVICTEPAALAGNTGRFAGSYFAQMLYNPAFGTAMPITGIDTPYVLYRDLFRGTCVHANGVDYLEVSAEQQPGDMRTLPEYRNALLESVGFGMHVLDYNIPLDDLIETVKQQAAASGAL